MRSFPLLFIFLSILSCERRIKFDENHWKKYPNERYKMADDLIKSQILINKSKNEVRTLLSDDCKDCDDDSNDWMYFLGEGFHKLDRKWEIMDIKFYNDRVSSVSIRN